MTVRNTIFAAILASFPIGFGQDASAQSNFDNPITAEVIDGWQLPDGRRMAGLRLTLAPGWKTYWRTPGDAGIPPQFDWKRARNLGGVAIDWPAPTVFVDNGFRSLGYKDQVILPLTITARDGSKPVHLRGRMNLGVCAEVCVPYALDIDQKLFAEATSPTPAIIAALTSLPYSAKEAGVHSATCRVTPTQDGMQIQADVSLPSTGGNEVVVIEPNVPGLWVSEADTKRSGQSLTATSEMVHIDGDPFSIDRSRVRITVIGDDYAVDVQGCKAG
ncbi:MAG: protein-disulfide reductase DsbD domain-containing protein [Paracoccaceae bacterium]